MSIALPFRGQKWRIAVSWSRGRLERLDLNELGAILTMNNPTADINSVLSRMLLTFRRAQRGHCSNCDCSTCLENLKRHLDSFASNNGTLNMRIAAFPYKSPNRFRTLSDLPDKSEEVALESLVDLTSVIGRLSQRAVHFDICADGLLFVQARQAWGLTELHVRQYVNRLREQLFRASRKLPTNATISIRTLEDFLGPGNLSSLMMQLTEIYPQSFKETILATINSDLAASSMYCGIKRFYEYDFECLRATGEISAVSRKSIHKMAAEAAKEVFYLSAIYRLLVDSKLPKGIRWSIHPLDIHQSNTDIKLGLSLGETRDIYFAKQAIEYGDDVACAPWQSVWVEDSISLRGCRMKRVTAERLGAKLVENNSQSSYFVINNEQKCCT